MYVDTELTSVTEAVCYWRVHGGSCIEIEISREGNYITI